MSLSKVNIPFTLYRLILLAFFSRPFYVFQHIYNPLDTQKGRFQRKYKTFKSFVCLGILQISICVYVCVISLELLQKTTFGCFKKPFDLMKLCLLSWIILYVNNYNVFIERCFCFKMDQEIDSK